MSVTNLCRPGAQLSLSACSVLLNLSAGICLSLAHLRLALCTYVTVDRG